MRVRVPAAQAVDVFGALGAFDQRRSPSNECASLPNPKYGSMRQYLRLWALSAPGRAKFETS